MEKVIQQNAANAEEGASASQELNAQSNQMKIIVADMVSLVGGNNGASGSPKDAMHLSEEHDHMGMRTEGLPHLDYGKKHQKTTESDLAATEAHQKKLSPEQAIPLDENEFQSF